MTVKAQRTGMVAAGDVNIFWRAFGKPGEDPVLIVHGLSYFSYDWIDIARALASDREVVAVDMRGFGDSDWSPDGDYSVPTFAADLLAVINARGWSDAVLMGHSMGGRPVLWCAAEHPERVSKVILVDYSPQNAKAGVERTTRTVAGVPDAFASVGEAMRYFGADPADTAKRARYEAYLRPAAGGFVLKRDIVFRDRFRKALETGKPAPLGVDMWETLGRVRCPILALRGRQSDMFAPETAEKMKATNAGLRLIELDGGHNLGGDNPLGLIEAARAFL